MRKSLLIKLICLSSVVTLLVTDFAHAQRRRRNRFPPIENAEFFGKVTKSKVTERFEIYDPHSREELQTVKDMGFDQVILDRAPLHKDATEVGLDVVIANWWTHKTEQKQIDDMIAYCRQVEPGRLVGISVMDEPERNSPDTDIEWYVDLYEELKPQMTDELEGVDLEISYWGPLESWDQRHYDLFSFLYESADVMRLMPYPDLHEGPLGDVYLMMRRSDRVMSIAPDVNIPKTVILQTWILPPENKLPTIEELRVMAYQAMLGGASTLSFFEYRPEVWDEFPGFEEDFAKLMTELVSLRFRLKGAEIESRLEENGILYASASWPSGKAAEILINTNREETEGLEGLGINDESLAFESSTTSEPPLAPAPYLALGTPGVGPAISRNSCCLPSAAVPSVSVTDACIDNTYSGQFVPQTSCSVPALQQCGAGSVTYTHSNSCRTKKLRLFRSKRK